MGDAATSQHGSRMPRWLGRRRWTSVRDRSMKEEQQIWFGIARLDAQAAAEVGLSWPRLPPGRIRRCGFRRGELGITVVDLEVIGAFVGSAHLSPSAVTADGYKSITASARSRKMMKIYCRLTARKELALDKRL
ncbi:hypothetical protein B296_00054604 [Ensete ventricosum]|uniref:Uncharacterized protein n=1 Tax=Ensete ventricosum TaxID=4639 RepID=A0A426X4X6_ENSVE|nr:hypothetical protein B296_00054604 [Ensete ventricosum]